MILCLLAITFAIEAKVAGYLPPNTLGNEVHAAKALPADVPQVILHGLSDHNPLYPLPPFSMLLAVLIGSCIAAVHYCGVSLDDYPSPSRSGFSPEKFSRPPPAL